MYVLESHVLLVSIQDTQKIFVKDGRNLYF